MCLDVQVFQCRMSAGSEQTHPPVLCGYSSSPVSLSKVHRAAMMARKPMRWYSCSNKTEIREAGHHESTGQRTCAVHSVRYKGAVAVPRARAKGG